MSEFISRNEYEEYKERMHDEHNRQNNRIKQLEDAYKQQGEIISSIKELAATQKGILEEQKKQGERIEHIEQIPANRWNTLVVGVLSAAAGSVGTALVAAILNFM